MSTLICVFQVGVVPLLSVETVKLCNFRLLSLVEKGVVFFKFVFEFPTQLEKHKRVLWL